MQRIMLRSKLHRATVTMADLEYEGSITIDSDLMDALKMTQYERVLVADMANGNRFETYAIPAPAGSGEICVNGATSHLANVGDRLTIFTFALVPEEEVRRHRPLILVVDENNKPVGGLR